MVSWFFYFCFGIYFDEDEGVGVFYAVFFFGYFDYGELNRVCVVVYEVLDLRVVGSGFSFFFRLGV